MQRYNDRLSNSSHSLETSVEDIASASHLFANRHACTQGLLEHPIYGTQYSAKLVSNFSSSTSHF